MHDEALMMSAFPQVEHEVPDFTFKVYDPKTQESTLKHLNDYRGRWVVLFFYPADFTFVCPTELKDLQKLEAEFAKLENTELLVVSKDTVHSHKVWLEVEKMLAGFPYPMVSDRKSELSEYFGIHNAETGNSERGTFIIDPAGNLKSIEIVTENIGRSAKELLRKLHALHFIAEHPGMACPASWNDDMVALRPDVKTAGNVEGAQEAVSV